MSDTPVTPEPPPKEVPCNAAGKPFFPDTLLLMACPQCMEARLWPLNCGHNYVEWFAQEYIRASATTPQLNRAFCYAPGDEGVRFCGDPEILHCEILGDAAFWESSEGHEHLVKCMRDDHLIHHAFVPTPPRPEQELPERIELLPCPLPLCKSRDVALWESDDIVDDAAVWVVECNTCTLRVAHNSKAWLINLWNTRADLAAVVPLPQPAVGELRKPWHTKGDGGCVFCDNYEPNGIYPEKHNELTFAIAESGLIRIDCDGYVHCEIQSEIMVYSCNGCDWRKAGRPELPAIASPSTGYREGVEAAAKFVEGWASAHSCDAPTHNSTNECIAYGIRRLTPPQPEQEG